MRAQAPFQPEDLADLGRLLDRADAVVPMREIAAGLHGPDVIGMRHDVDNVIEPAVKMARWERERGYRSTYFILHTSPYWQLKDVLAEALEEIADCGHEIGFHVNAISEALLTGLDPLEVVFEAVTELRGYGYEVTGVVAHGDPLCHRYGFVNDEIFTESARPDYGAPDRFVGPVRLCPVPRSTFGFEYDPNWLPRDTYLSDSGGVWSLNFEHIAASWPFPGQLHMLVHADWWGEAFKEEVANVA